MKSEKAKALLLGTLIGDAITLGVHWIYDTNELATEAGDFTGYIDPVAGSAKYHPNRKAGEQTHYGDQFLVLVESIRENRGFYLSDFARRWQDLFDGYDDYVDGATKKTLANLKSGAAASDAGSDSDELAAVSRVAAIVAAYPDASIGELQEIAWSAVSFTHGNPVLKGASEFFIRVLKAVEDGKSIEEALSVAASVDYDTLDAAAQLASAKAVQELEAVEAIGKLGQSCHFKDAFPATLYILLRYGNDPERALLENAKAGGDSAARSLLAGAVLAAKHGIGAFPQSWFDGLKASTLI
ncbi:ADP-ribosylglycohydrolase family protein [Rubellicoccus peritrichatus]|uniref:ADP-ribosylglycohydrolase family protein n=1 Tax=Rubellicoccus peritrichatus TaxID=3080537 RepID=A0AAQ3QWJ0_9BACT|nr:ADP-ribosylglycohydrolase family protein [Puniceicoccus sp. CR14]WOO42768.1 ADP-ribosylglycohydrolase family protein [Puniceicoccus sp. CR14]